MSLHQQRPSTTKAYWIRLASYASIATSASLVLLKLAAWSESGSVSILASLLDSTLDVFSSILIAVAVVISQRPPDKEHRFGHGKAEPLAALAQSIFIAGSAVYLIVYSVNRLLSPQAVEHANTAMMFMAAGMLLVVMLITFQRFVIFKTGSTAIRSDSLNYIGDLASNFLVLLGLWLSHITWLDPTLAFCIALFIFTSAFKIAFDSGNQLLDRELPDAFRAQVQDIILSSPNVLGVNDLRTYQSGPNRFIQFDLELDDMLPLVEAHRITEEVTARLKAFDPDLDVMAHQEPASVQNDASHHHWGKE